MNHKYRQEGDQYCVAYQQDDVRVWINYANSPWLSWVYRYTDDVIVKSYMFPRNWEPIACV